MLTSSWVRHVMKQSAIMLVGSALYAIAIYLTAILNIPGADNVQLRPGVAIPILCGALFGPVAGFVTGFVGNLAADQFLGWGFWFYWYIGNGIMGLAAGLFRAPATAYPRAQAIVLVVGRAALGILLGMAIASISEYWVTESSWNDIVWVNFVPAFVSNLLNAIIIVPIALVLYGVLRESTSGDAIQS
jgi:energy-coupling factor transport system substrate-specific component